MATTRRTAWLIVVVAAAISAFLLRSTGAEAPEAAPGPPVTTSTVPSGQLVQMVAPDAIEPVYDPTFVDGAAIDWTDDALVIGVEIAEESHAYPLSHLHQKEIVIDRVGDVPIAVSY